MTDATNLIRIVEQCRPTEIYNLAAQSHVQVSFDSPEYTANVDALGTLRLLEAIRILGLSREVRFYQASTSELFGKVQETPQRETTPFYPRSRSEEHTSELQSLMRISYAVFCLKKKTHKLFQHNQSLLHTILHQHDQTKTAHIYTH